MHLHARISCFCIAALGILLNAASASAQSNVFVTGAAFADIKRFDSVDYDPRVLAADGDPFSLDGTGAGGGIRIGTFLHPKWSLELGIDAGSATKQNFPNPFPSILEGTSLRMPELSASTRFLSVSTVVGFHPPKIGRVQLGYLAGFSFVRATHETVLPDFISIFDGGIASVFGSITFGPEAITPTIFPPLPITTRTTRRIDYAPAAVLGFEAAIDVTSRLAVVPEVRAQVFSSGGRSVFLIRPGAGVRWSF